VGRPLKNWGAPWLARDILAARNERFAGFAQVSEGAVLFGCIGSSIMPPIDGPLALGWFAGQSPD
jgi:hypothetical protein